MPLVDHNDSVLVVIDAQEGFYGDDLPSHEAARAREALARMTWLAKVARRLAVPAVLTEEDPQRNGATFPAIADVFPDATTVVKPTMRVVVVEDAVFSPGEMHDRGLARMLAEGIEMNHCKGLAYEWTRTLERSRSVLHASDVGEPPFRL